MENSNIAPITVTRSSVLKFSETYIRNDIKDVGAGVAMVLLYAALLRSGKSVKEAGEAHMEVKRQLETNTSLLPHEFTTEHYHGRVDVLERLSEITLSCPKKKYALCGGADLDLPASVTYDDTANKLSFTINLS